MCQFICGWFLSMSFNDIYFYYYDDDDDGDDYHYNVMWFLLLFLVYNMLLKWIQLSKEESAKGGI